MEKKKFYVNLGSQEISQIKYHNNDEYAIYATAEEVILLRQIFDEMQTADGWAFVRAHVPFIPYHKDKSNDNYDSGMMEALQFIHDLGDDTTKTHIESLGIGIDNELR